MQKNQSDKKGSQKSLKNTDLEDNKLFEDQQMIQDERHNEFQGSNESMIDSFFFTQESNHGLKKFQPVEKSKSLSIFISLLFMILVISLTYFHKEMLSYLVIKLDVIQEEQHGKNSKFNQDKNVYKISSFQDSHRISLDQKLIDICPDIQETFHVDLDENYIKKKLPIEIQNQIELCQTNILGTKDLQILKQKWNQKFPETIINDEFIAFQQSKQNLLVLLKLFFSGGTYLNITVPYSKVHNRCQKFTLAGFDTIFGSFSQKNSQSILVPSSNIFLKVRFPYSPFIKQMIEKIAKNEDFLEQCRKKQCLIVKCLD